MKTKIVALLLGFVALGFGRSVCAEMIEINPQTAETVYVLVDERHMGANTSNAIVVTQFGGVAAGVEIKAFPLFLFASGQIGLGFLQDRVVVGPTAGVGAILAGEGAPIAGIGGFVRLSPWAQGQHRVFIEGKYMRVFPLKADKQGIHLPSLALGYEAPNGFFVSLSAEMLGMDDVEVILPMINFGHHF